jgi:hypothetical protein
VAKGKGHKEFLRAKPTTELNCVAKKPSPPIPSGAGAIDIALSIAASFGCMLNLTGRIINALNFN